MTDGHSASFAIIGGSGMYAMAGLEEPEELVVETPYGAHSDGLVLGRLEGQSVAFLARHGRSHALLPGEINFRANVWALKQLGVERILSASAVGSMREDIHPRDVVIVDQFIDRAPHRAATFFGGGVAAHVSLAEPICSELRSRLWRAATACGARAHERGTYLCIEGPAFSTRAESALYRTWPVDVIGMTNLHEAKLAREAEICYATLALVTDYDCWHDAEQAVTVEALLLNLRANAALAVTVARDVLREIGPRTEACGCGQSLSHAIITPREAIPEEARRRLAPILGRYLDVP